MHSDHGCYGRQPATVNEITCVWLFVFCLTPQSQAWMSKWLPIISNIPQTDNSPVSCQRTKAASILGPPSADSNVAIQARTTMWLFKNFPLVRLHPPSDIAPKTNSAPQYQLFNPFIRRFRNAACSYHFSNLTIFDCYPHAARATQRCSTSKTQISLVHSLFRTWQAKSKATTNFLHFTNKRTEHFNKRMSDATTSTEIFGVETLDLGFHDPQQAMNWASCSSSLIEIEV